MTLTIIIALFTLVPAACYLLSALIARRYYTLKTPLLESIVAQLARGEHRSQKRFGNISPREELL